MKNRVVVIPCLCTKLCSASVQFRLFEEPVLVTVDPRGNELSQELTQKSIEELRDALTQYLAGVP